MAHPINALPSDFFDELQDRIASLHALANDPVAFAQLRREILQDYFGTIEADRQAEVRTLQDQINMEAAVTLNPMRVLGQLVERLDDQVAVIKVLTNRHHADSASSK